MRRELCRLFLISRADGLAHFEKSDGARVGGHHQIAQMRGESANEEEGIEAFVAYFVVCQQCTCHVSGLERIDKTEVIVVVEHVEVGDGAGVCDVAHTGSCHLVEDGECIAHRAVGFLGYHVEGFGFGRYAFLRSDVLQMLHHVVHRDALEIVHLASAQDCGQYLVLFGGGENENHVPGRFFESLEESVECRRGEHVHLVDDEDAVTAVLRRHVHLVHDVPYVVDRIV